MKGKHMTPEVAAWLHQLVSRQVIEVGHPDARTAAAMAWKALDQLEAIMEEARNG